MGLKKNIIETLASTPVRYINFTFANRMISPVCYFEIARKVDGGTIKTATDSSLGNTATYDPGTNTITAESGSYGETYLHEKALLVHECTHAVLDCLYNGRDMNGDKAGAVTVMTDESIAYIAQAIYRMAANAPKPTGAGKPEVEAYNAIETKVTDYLARPWTGCETLAFTADDVKKLQQALRNDPLYKADVDKDAVHNG